MKRKKTKRVGRVGERHHYWGKKRTAESVRKMVEGRRRNGSYVAWNKGKTGIYSREVRKKMGLSKIGKHHSLERRIHLSEMMTGRPCPWLKGKTLNVAHRKKISAGLKKSGKQKGHKKYLVTWQRILDEVGA